MSKANTPYNKICLYCHNEFVAQKRTTKYCSHKCNQRAYKQSKRESTHQQVSEKELVKSSAIKTNLLLEEIAASIKSIETEIHLSLRPYLTVKEVGNLLNMSRTSIYRLTESGKLPLYTLGNRKVYIKRSDIDNLFQNPKTIKA
ncbi:MAG: helix-turn-helix domain-containing protein [Bacteroidetes bacterium]|nr:helix-turn-helix domain-containing protein [Bacteroidota bacterium]